MKNSSVFFTVGTLFILLTLQASGQTSIKPAGLNVHIVPMDIAVENLRVVRVSNLQCEKNKVFVSFTIRNKYKFTNATSKITFAVNGQNEEFVLSPLPADLTHFELNPNQTITVNANAEIKSSWSTQGEITVSSRPYNIDGGSIQFSETFLSDNQQHVSANFPMSVQGYCICNTFNSIIDTTSIYIIQGIIKTQNSGTQVTSASLAVSNNLFAVLSRDYAAQFKFKFSGFQNSNNTIPTYNIVFANSLICLTKGNAISGDLTFSENTGSDTQKWILKKNENGSYSIFNAGSALLSCTSIGRTANLGPTFQQPYLKFYSTYEDGNKFQQFELIKLE
jgi:hypothetical protein